jgi:predicted Rossmann fold nucleotide-binding protein DprA/Smf involved in DNA uptake
MAHMPEPAYWLALAYTVNLNLARAKSVAVEWCVAQQRPLSALFEMPSGDTAARSGLTPQECAALQTGRASLVTQAAWLAELAAAGVRIITRADEAYPAALARTLPLAAQPLLLFSRGEMAAQHTSVAAIVGDREADPLTVEIARDLGALLAEEGVVLVSGLGKGVGRAGVDGALSVTGGRAIVVLPLGISTFETDRDLIQAAEQGRALLLSPFHPDASFSEANAAARNRLIVGLLDALIVMQAGERGLVRDMADETLRLGKELYVWEPDPADGAAAAGNRALIEVGGLPVSEMTEVMDIVDGLAELARARRVSLSDCAAATPHVPDGDENGAMDPQAVLDVLSRAGHVPEALRRRLGQV